VSERKRAGILCVGTELTEGIIRDGHVGFLGSHLTSMGLTVSRAVFVPDDPRLLHSTFAEETARSDIVIIAGGLGPTSDDLTREIAAEVAGEPLVFHDDEWLLLQKRFAGRKLSETNRKQAMAPRGFSLIRNPNGTAPGFHGMIGETLVIALPGPPHELQPMFLQSVIPLLEAFAGSSVSLEVLWGTALMVAESNLEEAFQRIRIAGLSWGTRVEEDRIVFSVRGGGAADRETFMKICADSLGALRIRRGDVKPAKLLMDALLSRETTLVSAESCTGGLVGKWLTDIPGSSRAYWGGYITYSNPAKEHALGVDARLISDHGAVSGEVVTAMAQGALEKSGADVSVAISGIAGPDGGTPEKPVGTVWIAVCGLHMQSTARVFSFPGGRDMVRRRAAVTAMLLAEARIRGEEFLDTFAKW
jgi:nicotinamide-nucleotide amidase